MHPKVTALVYVAARAPDAGEDYTALAKNYPTPPATAGIVFDDDGAGCQRGCILARLRGRLAGRKRRVLYAVQSRSRSR